MKSILFLLVIFPGALPLISSVPRYYLIQTGKSWDEAQAYCRATYTDMAIIKSNDDLLELQSYAVTQLFSSSAWIGLYNDVNSWRWSIGNEPLGSLTYWYSGEPNNWEGSEECLMMNSNGWVDKPCKNTYPFVCVDYVNSQRYVYISNPVTWADAQSYCRKQHTDLASDKDPTEHSKIMALTTGERWLGLFRDSWKWVDETNLTTITWMTGEPNNVQTYEKCGYLYNGQAADALCTDIMPFFCYSAKKQQQFVQMKVQSDEDPNNPAVKEAIMEQIKKKLKEQFPAEDVLVKWKEKPGGAVFQKENTGGNPGE